MKDLLISEYQKSKNTLAFRSAIILPFAISILLFFIFFINADDFLKMQQPNLWTQLLSILFAVMGTLILPMYAIFLAYSINFIEHKADTWKNLFTLPVSNRAIFFSKYLFTLLVFALFLICFYLGTILVGYTLGIFKPELGFQNYNLEYFILQIFSKLFLGSLFLISFQFLVSILWSDFMKSMGLGLVLTIASIILYKWEFSYLLPHAQPMQAINSIFSEKQNFQVSFFTKDVYAGLTGTFLVIILSYLIMKKRSIK